MGCSHHLCVPLSSCLALGVGPPPQLASLVALLQWAWLQRRVARFRGGAERDRQVEFRTAGQRGGGGGERDGGLVRRWGRRVEGGETPHPDGKQEWDVFGIFREHCFKEDLVYCKRFCDASRHQNRLLRMCLIFQCSLKMML